MQSGRRLWSVNYQRTEQFRQLDYIIMLAPLYTCYPSSWALTSEVGVWAKLSEIFTTGCTAISDDVAGHNGREEGCPILGMMFGARGWLASIPVALSKTTDPYSLMPLALAVTASAKVSRQKAECELALPSYLPRPGRKVSCFFTGAPRGSNICLGFIAVSLWRPAESYTSA